MEAPPLPGAVAASLPSAADGLSAAEIACIEEGLPNLFDWGPHLLVPFIARKLRRARLSWLNRRWFIERGFRFCDEASSARLEHWLVDQFAYAVPEDIDDADAFDEVEAVLHADRYGSTSGSFPHGGSGRAALIRRFHVKGVGVTPLVGQGADRAHSHGCASLDVALREAIYGEIADLEFPYGAVPVIAILETGLTFLSSGTPSRPLRRALIVRPAMIRPAHLQRAPAFVRPAGNFVSVQAHDTERTRAVVRKFVDDASHSGGAVARLVDLFERIARQVAFGQVQRLYGGGYFSSNLTIEAELLDFGNMHAFPDWSNVQVLPHDLGFGKEMTVVQATIRSLLFYCRKFGGIEASEDDLRSILDSAERAYETAFDKACAHLLALDGEAEDAKPAGHAAAAFRRYFKLQQQSTLNASFGDRSTAAWLHEPIVGSASAAPGSAEHALLTEIRDLLREGFGSAGIDAWKTRRAWFSASRLLKPRAGIYRESLRRSIGELLDERFARFDPAPPDLAEKRRFATFIDDVVASARRHWRNLPANLLVIGYANRGRSSVLLCEAVPAGEFLLWLEGAVCGEHLDFFGASLHADDFLPLRIDSHGAGWSVAVRDFDRSEGVVRLHRRTLHYPEKWHFFETPPLE
ncbi:hypothetical protein [Tahibacter soli]|uniref:Uncharacterized protein n=1 Tax=Tahibacter soli TaxID=2983605 RepID=A0A9X3YM24_9GAMM|nr:hypothetical protein [Tahibacter soli]MDC8014886.1 hypothetical protein [Tahibacter soli]